MDKSNEPKSWADTVAKLLPGIGAVIAGICIPLVIHISGEKNRSNQLYAEIVSKREMSDSELRARMFESLIKTFFGEPPKEQSNEKKLTLLRLLALNFHEFFNLAPLYDELYSEMKPEEDRKRLIEIAREIVDKQEAMLSQVEEGRIFVAEASEGGQGGIMVPAADKPAYRGHRLGVSVFEVDKERQYAVLQVEDLPEGRNDIGTVVKVRFKLNYYDTPFIDNTKLSNNVRFAITLQEIGTVEAERNNIVKMKIIFFPETFMSSRDRPYLEEMLQQLIVSKKRKD
jgi:hypothetical protein